MSHPAALSFAAAAADSGAGRLPAGVAAFVLAAVVAYVVTRRRP